MIFCAALALLSGCDIEGAIKRNDDRYMRSGAQDSPLTGVNDTYHLKFLDKYRITHEWPRISNCSYRKIPTLNVKDGHRGEFWAVRDIYEEGGKTWQRFEGMKPFDFDRYVRSVKRQVPIYAPPTKEELEASNKELKERIERSRKTGRFESTLPNLSERKPIRYEEKEFGFQVLCGESWWVTSHFLDASLHKRDLVTWRAIWTERNPKGEWSERRIDSNVWTVQETAEQDFEPRPLNGVGGPFQTWLLPIGDTGYTLALELGASQESLQYPDAHARFQVIFRHLIESVKIEPLNEDHPDNLPSRKPAP